MEKRTQVDQILQISQILEHTMPLHDDETSYTDLKYAEPLWLPITETNTTDPLL
jgi:hypothetical protein